MNDVKSGWTLIILSLIFALYIVQKYFTDYFTIENANYYQTKDYLISIFHRTSYLITLSTSLILGLALLKQEEWERIRKIKTILIVLIIILIVLELPIYECEYYNIPHSFWESRTNHFH